MYQPKRYARNDREFIFPFIQAYPFATLVVQGDQLLATHTPVITEGDASDFELFGHVANHNPLCNHMEEGKEALLIFKGPDAYISSSWYEEKDISTWNYSAVHVNGPLKIQHEEELEDSLVKLVKRFESEQEQPLYYEDIPEEMLREHLPLITGFRLIPEEVRGVKKWSQTLSKTDRSNVKEHLIRKGFDPDILAKYLDPDGDEG